MYVASPSCVQERRTTIRTMIDTVKNGRSEPSETRARRTVVTEWIFSRIAGIARMHRSAATTAGTSSADAPCRPQRETSRIATGPPMPNPRFPPTEKKDIPVARRSEVMHAVALNPSGWNAAVPRPVNMTKVTSHPTDGANGTSAIPIPEIPNPMGRRNGNGLRSVKYPKRGWITEEVMCVAISSIPAPA
jgi:hypothetical protein